MTCQARLEGDEYVCARCATRWDRLEAGPPCLPEKPSHTSEPLEIAVAKAIFGPRMDKWIGRNKMLALRDHKWTGMASRNEQREALTSARAVLKELKAMPREELLRALDQGNWE